MTFRFRELCLFIEFGKVRLKRLLTSPAQISVHPFDPVPHKTPSHQRSKIVTIT
jgi:hypothetical protein